MKTLQSNATGIFGIIGDTLTPEIIIQYVNTFAQLCKGNKIVVGSDPRGSQHFLRPLVKSILMATGCDVVDIGIVPTATVQFITRKLEADGGISITASHYPVQWNGLKFIGPDGLFLSKQLMNNLLIKAERPNRQYANWKILGTETTYPQAINDHLTLIYNLSLLDIEQIRRKQLKVALDCVNGTGGVILPSLLKHLGCEIIPLNLKPADMFAHSPDPVYPNLQSLIDIVKESKADLGFAVDPENSRCAIIGNDGNPFGNEYTLALITQFILSKKMGNIIVDLSTSRAVEELVTYYNCGITKTRVGEMNVVAEMKATQALMGGTNNGGIIIPQFHLCRDATVAIALILQYLSEHDKSICDLKQGLPQYYLLRDQVPLTNASPEKIINFFAEQYQEYALDTNDGIRIDTADWWIHIRKSTTREIMYIVTEARTPEKAWHLLQSVKQHIN